MPTPANIMSYCSAIAMHALVESRVVPAEIMQPTPASLARSRISGISAGAYLSKWVWQSPSRSVFWSLAALIFQYLAERYTASLVERQPQRALVVRTAAPVQQLKELIPGYTGIVDQRPQQTSAQFPMVRYGKTSPICMYQYHVTALRVLPNISDSLHCPYKLEA